MCEGFKQRMSISLEELPGNFLAISFVDECKLEVAVAVIVRPSTSFLFAAETYVNRSQII
jgi:hypothetical protein